MIIVIIVIVVINRMLTGGVNEPEIPRTLPGRALHRRHRRSIGDTGDPATPATRQHRRPGIIAINSIASRNRWKNPPDLIMLQRGAVSSSSSSSPSSPSSEDGRVAPVGGPVGGSPGAWMGYRALKGREIGGGGLLTGCQAGR